MLRHLGPVSPVSGSRHETSWPELSKQQNKPTTYTTGKYTHTQKKYNNNTPNIVNICPGTD